MSNFLPDDQVITETYVRIDVPSDSLVRSSESMRRFVDLLPAENRGVDREQLAHRIITLRKLGRLPRLRRKVH